MRSGSVKLESTEFVIPGLTRNLVVAIHELPLHWIPAFAGMTFLKAVNRFIIRSTLTAMLLFTFSPSLFAEPDDPQKLYPMPLAESEKILYRRLMDKGFEVTKTFPDAGSVQLNAVKENERWRITLRPYSPLASYIEPEYFLNDKSDPSRVKELQDYLESYSKDLYAETENPKQPAPEAVSSRKKSVVCIKAKAQNRPLQFSGFFIDKKGLILATAHDLEGVKDVTVFLDNGKDLKGKLKRIDFDRDLALISINSKSSPAISLLESRNLLEYGERIFFIGCPLNHQGTIQSGVINGLPRRVNKQPLWQALMETLPGSSGSPVFDTQGNLVGIIKGRYRGTESTGFIITMETVMEFLKEK